MNEELAKLVAKLQINVTSCAARFTQIAGIEAVSGPQDDMVKMVAEFHKRRDFIVDGLNALPGFRCHKPDGAFYVYADVGHLTDDSMAFAHHLLATAGVAVATGVDFDTADGGRFVRFSFAGEGGEIEQALERLARALPRV